MAMRRADRRDSNYDNEIKYPRAKKKEPIPLRELEQRFLTVQSQRDEWKQKAQENQSAATELVDIKPKFQMLQAEVQQWEKKATHNYHLYCEEQQQHQQTLSLYTQEKDRSTELLAKYEEANAQKEQYLSLYNETKIELKHERQSKAGIKGWETRRKRENERLKQEIGEMTLILRDSLERKEEAVNNLYILADRMDRIQSLVDSVEEESSNTPIAFLEKLKRIWAAVKEILTE